MRNVKIPKAKISNFCKKNHISSLSLFGSILTERFGPKSDIDFLVEFNPRHIPNLFDVVRMESELKELVGRNVDLRTPRDLSKYFRDDVISQAKRIYGSKRAD